MGLTPSKTRRAALHLALIAGSAMFLLPYVWLLGNSWKLDKETQSEGLDLLPRAPEPRLKSPYIDPRTFELEKPIDAEKNAWNEWIRAAVVDEIGKVLARRRDQIDATFAVDNNALIVELTEGVFEYVVNILPRDTWIQSEDALRATLREAVDQQMINDAFDQCFRYFALGQILLKDQQFRIYPIGDTATASGIWSIANGVAEIAARRVFDRSVAAVRYNFETSSAVSIAAEFPLPFDWTAFKRISISYRRDQTWHAMRVFLEVNGTRYATASPQYLGQDDFAEASYQLPSADDERLSSRLYTLLDPTDQGVQYDHGQNVLRVVVQLTQSKMPQALYAKGTENYREVLKRVPFLRYLCTSAFLALMNIIGTCLSCSLAAYALARLRWPGRNLCFILVLATLMIPPQVTMIPSFVIYKQLGWYNTLAPLWAPAWLGINAFAIFLLRQAMKGIPRDLEDAARIDGCGYFRTYWYVALPLMKPTLAAISVFTFMYVWNDFMGPLIYVNDQHLYPAALGLFAFMAGREEQFTWIMAASVLMTIPVVAIFFALQRYFIQGVALTGMKG